MTVKERFLKYVSFDTQSDENTHTSPSTTKQFELAKYLKDELASLGMVDVSLSDYCYVMATLPANTEKKIPTVGFIAHMDTSPDASGANIKTRTVHYDGGEIVLNEEEKIVLSPMMFPELTKYQGQDIIVTDGKTLLGADDKAGIAAIVSAISYFVENPSIEHGTIKVAFTPDEEIGEGPNHFDVKAFGADFAYTIDGGEIGELEFENFNAAAARVIFHGLNVHPGYAKDKMINACLLANEFASWLPKTQRPQETEGYEGFFHLTNMSGTVEEASLSYIVRDHDRNLFEQKKTFLKELVAQMNKLHPGSATLELRDQYYNMIEVMKEKKFIVDLAAEAMRTAGVSPNIRPIRGGTDGARLSFMGLPCPNIFAGGLNFHGRFEYLPVESLKKSCDTIIKIAELTTKIS